MLDPKYLRADIETAAKRLAVRGFKFDLDQINELEAQRKELQVKTQELQNQRNTRSKGIGQAKAKGEDIEPLLAEMGKLGDQLDQNKNELDVIQNKLNEIALSIPNLPHPDVPAVE